MDQSERHELQRMFRIDPEKAFRRWLTTAEAAAVRRIFESHDPAVGPDDLYHETIARTLSKIARYDPRKGWIRVWFIKVGLNLHRSNIRRQGGRRPKPFADLRIDDGTVHAADKSSSLTEKSRMRLRILSVIDELRGHAKQIILMRLDNLRYCDIARELGKSNGYVQITAERAEMRIRKLLIKRFGADY